MLRAVTNSQSLAVFYDFDNDDNIALKQCSAHFTTVMLAL